MTRIKFPRGKQKEFLDNVIRNLNLISLRSLLQYGFEINYSTLKNYYREDRTLPKEFFDQLVALSKIDTKKLKFKILDDNFGNVIGGKKSRRY